MPSWSATKVAFLAAIALLAASLTELAEAQRADAPRIVVAPTITAEPASQAPLSIQVGPPGSVPGNTFVRLRGLPGSVSLTEGYAIAQGSWAVPLFGLPSLKAIVPAGVAGRTEIIIQLVGVDGATLAETKTTLVVGAAPNVAPQERPAAERVSPDRPLPRATVATPPPAANPTAPAPERIAEPRLQGEEKQRAERLIANGDRHLELRHHRQGWTPTDSNDAHLGHRRQWQDSVCSAVSRCGNHWCR